MKYYIGDPCYVLSPAQWETYMRVSRATSAQQVRFTLDDVIVWVASTAHGDGVYTLRDEHGDEVTTLPVDSGTIGVIPWSLVREDMRDVGLYVHTFEEPPVCTRETHGEEEGFLRVGNLTVRTGAL